MAVQFVHMLNQSPGQPPLQNDINLPQLPFCDYGIVSVFECFGYQVKVRYETMFGEQGDGPKRRLVIDAESLTRANPTRSSVLCTNLLWLTRINCLTSIGSGACRMSCSYTAAPR